MAKIHIILQGKGGVGKSLVASSIAQYKKTKDQVPLCIDTDPINQTFTGYSALNVETLNIMEGDEINSRKFDMLIEKIASSDNDVIIDNGAATFVPLAHYLISNQVAELLESFGHTLIIHTVITGGQAMLDTISGFSQLAKQFPEPCLFVVWLNRYWGDIETGGKTFEEMKAYKDNKSRVSALINIPHLKEETFGKDIEDMLQERLTFEEAISNEKTNIMTRQRLKIYQKDLFSHMDAAAVLS